MTSAEKIVNFPKRKESMRGGGQDRIPTGGAGDRGNTAIADRPRDRRQHSGILLSGAGLGSVGQRRYRGDRRKDHPERPH